MPPVLGWQDYLDWPEIIELSCSGLPIRPPVLSVGENSAFPILLDRLDLQVLEHVDAATRTKLKKKRKEWQRISKRKEKKRKENGFGARASSACLFTLCSWRLSPLFFFFFASSKDRMKQKGVRFFLLETGRKNWKSIHHCPKTSSSSDQRIWKLQSEFLLLVPHTRL